MATWFSAWGDPDARGQEQFQDSQVRGELGGCAGDDGSEATCRTEVPASLAQVLAEPARARHGRPSTRPVPTRPASVFYRDGEAQGAVSTSPRSAERVAGAPDRTILPLSRDFFTRVAGPEKLVIVSWTTGVPTGEEKGSRSWIAINLALSIRKHAPHLEKRFAYVSLDADAHRTMGEFGIREFTKEGLVKGGLAIQAC